METPAGNRMGPNVLAGIRVLDFTRVLAGPYATRILADFGAEVIKIQTAKTATGAEDNGTAYFHAWNRNKKSITLNMNHPEAKELLCKLVSLSNVVVENFTPRVMANWGIDYHALKNYKTDLIMLSISAMGQTGPWKNYAAYGPTLQALAGLTYLTSYRPEEPLGLGFAYGDHIIGLYGAIAVLAALEEHGKTGVGRYIDLSGLEALCTLIVPALWDSNDRQGAFLAGKLQGNDQPAPSGCYPCWGVDRWCVISVATESQWQALCRVTGHQAWRADERFATSLQRIKYRRALDLLLEEWTRRLSAEEAARVLQEEDIPAGVVQTAQDLAHDPQLHARNFFIDLSHPEAGATVSDRYAFPLAGKATADWRAAPLLGAGNEYVFQELLGLTPDEMALLQKKGVIG